MKEYQQAEEVTRQRLYLESFQRLLAKTKQVYIVDEEQKTLLPFMQLQGGQK